MFRGNYLAIECPVGVHAVDISIPFPWHTHEPDEHAKTKLTTALNVAVVKAYMEFIDAHPDLIDWVEGRDTD